MYGQLGDGGLPPNLPHQPKEIISNGVVAAAVGNGHSLFIKSDGSLWAMGENLYGQLGDGTTDSGYFVTNQPEKVVSSGVIAVAAGWKHSLFLKFNGGLWSMGENEYGQLGNGYTDPGIFETNLPQEIVAGGVTAIAAGGYHSLFLKSDGSLWGMGWSLYGQLGDGAPHVSTNLPEKIVASNVTAIAAGWRFSLFLKSDGSLWAMGENSSGQLGDGGQSSFVTMPEKIVSSGVTAIAAGAEFSLFLKSDGSLWAMGNNSAGQLGDDTLDNAYWPEMIVPNDVVAIAATTGNSLFLKSDGSLWGMGDEYLGGLGDGFTPSPPDAVVPTPEQILPRLQPVLIQTVSNDGLQFTATCGFGGNFYLLASSNLDQPLSQWTPVWTNFITAHGTNNFTVTLTNEINSSSQQFYILQSP